MKEKNENKNVPISPELVAKAKAGDQAAFSELYQLTNTALYRSIRAMVHNEDTAWDIEQETYLKAYQSLDKLDHNEAFLPWLRRISVNVTATEMSKRLPMNFSDLADEDGDLPEQVDLSIDAQPELAMDRKETSRLVREILSELPEQQHLVLGMHYYEDLSVKEICELLHLAPSTVKTQLIRGRKHVETRVRALEKQGVKLYGLSPMAFLVALMRRAEPAERAAWSTGRAVMAQAFGDAAATAVPVAAKTFGQVLAGRLLAGALAVALIGGGIWGGAKLLKTNQRDNPYQPTTVETNERLSGVETPEELTETGEALPVVTDPVVTEPAATEAVTTEPTEPARAANQCGEHLTWSFDPETGWLTISGSGPMDDYDEKENRPPWYERREKITDVSLPEELSSIGSYAFCDLTNLDDPDYLNGWFTRIKIPNSVVSVGSHAFQNANIVNLVLPESLSSVADSALSGCTALRELWVMNPDCAFGAEQEVSPELEVCGFPDSTAERFAREKGCSFNPMTPDQDAVVEQLRAEEPGRQGTRIIWAVKCAAGYMAKVVTFEPVSVTEEELQQAKQTGSMVVDGVECAYTESREQAEEWGYVNEDSEAAEGWSGWIHKDEGNGRSVYSVLREGDHYIFVMNYPHGESDHVLRQEEPRDLAWLSLDDDRVLFYEDYESKPHLSEFLSHEENRNCLDSNWFYYENLTLTEDGDILVMPIKFGAKR